MTLRFGEYQVERELARGGMGVVYVARHTRLGRRVALKVVSVGVSESSSERFDIETRAVAQLDHPNVVRIHEVGLERGRAFFAMELVEGESLEQRLQRDGPFDPRQAAVVIEAIARAVEHAHARGVLHRDLKPANVLLTTDDRPLLTDFGLARELSDERERLTRTGEVLGTPGYMPPEQANGEVHAISAASDVYGLGATLYTLLCGRPPFVADALPTLLVQIIGHPPEPPRALRPELDPELEAICLRTLEKTPARRRPEPTAGPLDGRPAARRPAPGHLRRPLRRARDRHRRLRDRWAGRRDRLPASAQPARPTPAPLAPQHRLPHGGSLLPRRGLVGRDLGRSGLPVYERPATPPHTAPRQDRPARVRAPGRRARDRVQRRRPMALHQRGQARTAKGRARGVGDPAQGRPEAPRAPPPPGPRRAAPPPQPRRAAPVGPDAPRYRGPELWSVPSP